MTKTLGLEGGNGGDKSKIVGTMVHRYTVILEPEEDGGFHAFIPALKGCHTHGDNEEEALANAQEAISIYIESLTARGEPIPAEDLLIRPVEVGV